LHLNLEHFVVFFLFCFGGFGLVFFPLWWDNDGTTSDTPSPGLEAEGLPPKLLRLKLYCIELGDFFYFFIFYFILFIYYFYFYLFLFFSQSSLCLSNACSAYCWLVHYLSLFISFKLLFVCLFVLGFLFVCLFFPLSLTSLLSFSSQTSILNISIVIITS
jgi:hypothetical protein